MLNGLDLFSGIGGLTCALSEWVRPVAYCEIDRYCQGVLLSRMLDGTLPKSPIWDDVSTLTFREDKPKIDILYGGFPCQDISIAGNGKGLEGERSGLFFEMLRLAAEIKPKYVFLENVPAISTRGGLQVVKTLAEMGYDCRWCVISAAAVGARHKRERWFLLANANISSDRGNLRFLSKKNEEIQKPQEHGKEKASESYHGSWWETEPAVGRMADGILNRVDRIKGLGNSVVPQQAKKAFEILMWGNRAA